MKTALTDTAASTTYLQRRIAVVQKFYPGSKCKYGVAKDTETGELIYFNMKRCREFMVGDDGPLFTDGHKDIWPKPGDAITFILDNKPVEAAKMPCMFLWNYEESYQRCLADFNKMNARKNDSARATKQEISPASPRNQDRKLKWKSHKTHRHEPTDDERNWGYKTFNSAQLAPEIDLVAEVTGH